MRLVACHSMCPFHPGRFDSHMSARMHEVPPSDQSRRRSCFRFVLTFFFDLPHAGRLFFFAAVHIICITYPCITPRFPLNTKLCIIIKHTKIYVVYFDSQHANGSLDGPASAFICTTRLMDTLELLDGPGVSRSSSGGMRYSSSSCSDING